MFNVIVLSNKENVDNVDSDLGSKYNIIYTAACDNVFELLTKYYEKYDDKIDLIFSYKYIDYKERELIKKLYNVNVTTLYDYISNRDKIIGKIEDYKKAIKVHLYSNNIFAIRTLYKYLKVNYQFLHYKSLFDPIILEFNNYIYVFEFIPTNLDDINSIDDIINLNNKEEDIIKIYIPNYTKNELLYLTNLLNNVKMYIYNLPFKNEKTTQIVLKFLEVIAAKLNLKKLIIFEQDRKHFYNFEKILINESPNHNHYMLKLNKENYLKLKNYIYVKSCIIDDNEYIVSANVKYEYENLILLYIETEGDVV